MATIVGGMTDINRVCGRCSLNLQSGNQNTEHVLRFNLPVDPATPTSFPRFEKDGEMLIAKNFSQQYNSGLLADRIFKFSNYAVLVQHIRAIKWEFAFYKSSWANGSQVIIDPIEFLFDSGEKVQTEQMKMTLVMKDTTTRIIDFLIDANSPLIFINDDLRISTSGLRPIVPNPKAGDSAGTFVFTADITEIEDILIEYNSHA